MKPEDLLAAVRSCEPCARGLSRMRFLNLIQKTPKPITALVPPELSYPAVVVKIDPEECPVFARHYRLQISPLISLEVNATTVYGKRSYLGWLHQLDGKLVMFDPVAIADCILDRDLVPLLERFCPPILAEDRDFINSGPTEFRDTNGTRWIASAE
jgi:hypothetical protein